MHPTKNDLSKSTRAKVINLLNARLADALDLQMQAKQAHWNVKGPSFIALHELFDKVAESVEEAIDQLAERAVQLGGTAEGTLQAVTKRTSLKPYPLALVDGLAHVDALSNAMAIYGKKLRAAAGDADKLKDDGTADLLIALSQDADKYLWFVEAHLEGNR